MLNRKYRGKNQSWVRDDVLYFYLFFKFIKEVNIQSLKTKCPSAYKKMNQSVLGNRRINKSFFLPSGNSKSGKD